MNSLDKNVERTVAKNRSAKTRLIRAINCRLINSEDVSPEELAMVCGILEHRMPDPMNLEPVGLHKEYMLGRSLGSIYGS